MIFCDSRALRVDGFRTRRVSAASKGVCRGSKGGAMPQVHESRQPGVTRWRRIQTRQESGPTGATIDIPGRICVQGTQRPTWHPPGHAARVSPRLPSRPGSKGSPPLPVCARVCGCGAHVCCNGQQGARAGLRERRRPDRLLEDHRRCLKTEGDEESVKRALPASAPRGGSRVESGPRGAPRAPGGDERDLDADN